MQSGVQTPTVPIMNNSRQNTDHVLHDSYATKQNTRLAYPSRLQSPDFGVERREHSNCWTCQFPWVLSDKQVQLNRKIIARLRPPVDLRIKALRAIEVENMPWPTTSSCRQKLHHPVWDFGRLQIDWLGKVHQFVENRPGGGRYIDRHWDEGNALLLKFDDFGYAIAADRLNRHLAARRRSRLDRRCDSGKKQPASGLSESATRQTLSPVTIGSLAPSGANVVFRAGTRPGSDTHRRPAEGFKTRPQPHHEPS